MYFAGKKEGDANDIAPKGTIGYKTLSGSCRYILPFCRMWVSSKIPMTLPLNQQWGKLRLPATMNSKHSFLVLFTYTTHVFLALYKVHIVPTYLLVCTYILCMQKYIRSIRYAICLEGLSRVSRSSGGRILPSSTFK